MTIKCVYFILFIIGMYVTKRKLAVTIKPRLIISKNENQWCIEIDMKNKGTSTYFTEGTEVDTCNKKVTIKIF